MKKAAIHATKKETVFSDGAWVSNGYYLVRNEYAQLSSRKLQALVDERTPFTSKEGALSIGDDATVKDPTYIIDHAPKEDKENEILKTSILADIGSDGNTGRLYRGAAHVTVVESNYQEIMALGKTYQKQAEYVKIREAMITVYNNAELVALVMPVRTTGTLYKELRQVADLAQKGGQRI